ncbi:hypothetical protein GYMLUDRAFT_243310 [Collybiopsis luxurians FD-317 M1]|uniref:CFEM domain-containing protein n=1 Tax=Collybiopsis luxurians FD-317 M1 TaxID=944289 RepID=A0A0D0BD65_9AGAR|nr:hypothetical protein GYMLUDRAFT_243310 [Collybiopsis luxurians FD-317 M1]
MLSLLLTAFALIATLASSQTVPLCVQDCAISAAALAGCSIENAECLCTNSAYISTAQGCIDIDCTTAEQAEGIAYFNVSCAPFLSSGTSLPTSTSVGASLGLSATSVGTTSKADTTSAGATQNPAAPAGSDTTPALATTSSSSSSGSGSKIPGFNGASGNLVTGNDVLKVVVVVVAATVVGTLL